jgi:hypothetical protein
MASLRSQGASRPDSLSDSGWPSDLIIFDVIVASAAAGYAHGIGWGHRIFDDFYPAGRAPVCRRNSVMP